MKGRGMTLARSACCAAFALVCLALAPAPCAAADGAESPPDVLRRLADQARERERLFDGLDLRWSMQFGTDGQQAGNVRAEGRFILSGERCRSEVRIEGDFARYGWSPLEIAAFDGTRMTTLRVSRPDGLNGSILSYPPPARYGDLPGLTPTGIGIIWLFAVPGSVSEILESDGQAYKARYAASLGGAEPRVTLRGTTKFDGHDCDVVELTLGRQHDQVFRLHFARDLQGACVRLEGGLQEGDEFESYACVEMSGFREVRPGLAVPSGIRVFRTQGAAEMYSFSIDGIDFPPSFDDGLFSLVFPRGTRLRDGDAGVSYIVGEGVEGLAGELTKELAQTDSREGEVVEAGEPAVAEPAESAPLESADSAAPVEERPQAPAPRPPSAMPLLALALAAAVLFLLLALRALTKKH